ncbi:MAG: 4-hydroxyphenylpyruvate dioxygenase [Thermoplasmatales archaeon]
MTENNVFKGIDHIEFYVGSAKQWAYFHEKALGFKVIGYCGPETGIRDRISYLLVQGDVKLIFTGFLSRSSDIAKHVELHGDGVKDISLRVENIDDTINFIKERKVALPSNVEKIKGDYGTVRMSLVPTYGQTTHTLLDYGEWESDLPPGFVEVDSGEWNTGIKKIDHVVGNVEENKMDPWVDYYVRGLGFRQLISFDDKDISTQYSALRSKVVEYGGRKIIFPINEPALGLKKSQIQEYLDYYESPGVQHIALHSDNIIETVSKMREAGIQFLYTPPSYYDELEDRVGKIDEDPEKLKDLNILVDRDDDGYLLQIFTQPIGDRPTFFYEIIQRKGATSFGKGNFKALFESIEREQAKRGNL